MPTTTTRSVRGYELQRVVGRGGMATVYLARQPDLNRLVALKELGGLRAAEPSFARRFVREARVAGSLSHPNIVTVHDFFEHEGIPYIAMEYVPGGTLRPHMDAPALAEIAGVLENILAGLAYAERQGVVHRDLKPENLMVTSDGNVKIADFGIAKATGALQTSSFRTETGTTIGTPAYIAPEQAMGAEVGPWSDLYSVGVIVFEMLVGHTPFYDSDTPMAMALRHINEEIPTVTELRPDVEPEISEWVERMLVKDPALRTQTASDAWDEFEDLAIGLLGPRWRDGSALLAAPQTEGTELLPATAGTRRMRQAGTVGTRAMRPPDRGGTRDLSGSLTAAQSAPTTPSRPRRKPAAVLAAMTFLAVAAAAAAFAGGGGGGGDGTAAAPKPATTPKPAATAPAAHDAPTAAVSEPVSATLDDLRRSAAPHEAALAAAKSPQAQARAATDLAADYEGAADKLADGSQPAVVDALRQIGAAYRMAAAAALRGDAEAFRAAGADVDDGRQALDQALSGAPAVADQPPQALAPAQTPAPAPAAAPPSQPPAASSNSGGSGGANENENEPDENDNGD